jgi:uncharacterized membrane protein
MGPEDTRIAEPSRLVEKAVSLVLRVGVIASSSIIFLGLVLLVLKGSITGDMRIDAPIPSPRTIAAVLSGLVALDPASILAFGVLTLIATPFTRVAISIVAFALERDWRYVVITAIVLIILILGILLGKSAI